MELNEKNWDKIYSYWLSLMKVSLIVVSLGLIVWRLSGSLRYLKRIENDIYKMLVINRDWSYEDKMLTNFGPSFTFFQLINKASVEGSFIYYPTSLEDDYRALLAGYFVFPRRIIPYSIVDELNRLEKSKLIHPTYIIVYKEDEVLQKYLHKRIVLLDEEQDDVRDIKPQELNEVNNNKQIKLLIEL